MKIVAITDLHGSLAALSDCSAALKAADLVLLCGDITHFGHAREAEIIIKRLLALNPQVLAVAGNCDYPDVDAYLSRTGINLHARHVAVAGLGILGLGGSLPCPGKTPWEFSESEFDSLLCQGGRMLASGSPFVLVSHQPPLDTANDRIAAGMHVGSRKVLEFIQKHQPLICFTGHIHEGTGTDEIGITRIVNPGPFRGGHYTLANVDLPGRAVDVSIVSV